MEEKQISINTMIILLFLILTLLFISIYTSLAVFKKSYEQKEIVSIKVKDITPNIELEESYENVILNEDNHSLEITASKNKKTFVNIKLKNYTNINVKYKLFYINNNNLSELDSVKVSSRSDGKSTDVIEKNNIKNIRIGLNNQTEQELKFVIGVQGGYETNDIILEDGKTELGIMDEYLDEAILVDNEIQDKLPTYTTDSSDRGLFKLQDDK